MYWPRGEEGIKRTWDSSGRSFTVSSCSRWEVSNMSLSDNQSWTSINLYSQAWASAIDPGKEGNDELTNWINYEWAQKL